MWLEAYLRNGKVIQSNVVEVQTDDGQYDHLAGKHVGEIFQHMLLNINTGRHTQIKTQTVKETDR